MQFNIHNLFIFQILRSLTCWSGGFVDSESVEQSIHEAYIESITRAQHYVYIENQFFITLSFNNYYVRNQVSTLLFVPKITELSFRFWSGLIRLACNIFFLPILMIFQSEMFSIDILKPKKFSQNNFCVEKISLEQ